MDWVVLTCRIHSNKVCHGRNLLNRRDRVDLRVEGGTGRLNGFNFNLRPRNSVKTLGQFVSIEKFTWFGGGGPKRRTR
jgi:hypothetical protein